MDDLLFRLDNKLSIKITGKNINRFIKMLLKQNIELLKVKYVNRNEVIILIMEKDYQKIKKIKTICEISILNYHGKIKIKKILNINKYLILSIIIGYILLYFLSNIIFDIKVMHPSSKIRNILIKELKMVNIKRLSFKKNYNILQKIEKKIINKYKNTIEWLEIEELGTTYIVKVEERKIKDNKYDNQYQDIVASKNGVIKYIEASNGEIIKNINEYVIKGEIIISGRVTNNEKIVKHTKALGKVYAEVWYKTVVEYPLKYKEQYKTLNKKKAYYFNVVNFNIPIWDIKPYKNKFIEEKTILSSNLLPIKLVKQKQQEIRVINRIYTKEEAINKALDLSSEKLKINLKKDEKILSQKTLKIVEKSSKIIIEIFYKVYEDIGTNKIIIEE